MISIHSKTFFKAPEGTETIVLHVASMVSVNPDFSQKLVDVNVGGTKNIIQIFQSVDVDIHDGNIRTHAHSNLARIGSNASAAKDDNFCFWRSWYTRKQYTGTTIQFLQIFCTFLEY